MFTKGRADLRVALQSEYFINKVIYFYHSPTKGETKNLEMSSTLFLNLLLLHGFTQIHPFIGPGLTHEHESPVRKLRLRLHQCLFEKDEQKEF